MSDAQVPYPNEPRSGLDRRAFLRRSGLVAGGATLAGGALSQAVMKAAFAGPADPSVVGEWTAPFDIGTCGIHATLMHNGKVQYVCYGADEIGTAGRVWDPSDDSLIDITFTDGPDFFCGSQSQLPDGRLLFTGGMRDKLIGLNETTTFDPATNEWSIGPNLTADRWYPTNRQLGDGSILVFGGQKDPHRLTSSVQRYDPGTDTLKLLPRTANRLVGIYPRMHLLKGGRVFMAGLEWKGYDYGAQTAFFNAKSSKWTYVGDIKHGPRYNAPSVLLPGTQKVMIFGGAATTERDSTPTTEIIDLAVEKAKWHYGPEMHITRISANASLLPDGTVAVMGGARNGFWEDPVFEPEIFDPVAKTFTLMAPNDMPRGHHATSVLLPDARVVVAGQDYGDSDNTAEIFSPPYLFTGSRPEIDDAPSTIGYGQPLQISTDEAADIEKVVLMRPSAVTHSNDFEQRCIPLAFTIGAGVVNATSPVNGNTAPPGYYMLFILDGSGAPSVATWIQVGA